MSRKCSLASRDVSPVLLDLSLTWQSHGYVILIVISIVSFGLYQLQLGSWLVYCYKLSYVSERLLESGIEMF